MRLSPFRCLRPTPDAAARVASVPYDVINTEEARQLAGDNPDSFLRVVRAELELAADADPYADEVYARAATNLRALRDRGVLAADNQPSLYAYRLVMDGRAQTGVVGCVHIDDYEQDRIKKHEKTRPAKENDRTRHILELRADAEPVILTYRGVDAVDEAVASATRAAPLYDFAADDGVQHTVWKLPDPDGIVAEFASIPAAYVADGHHRCASAWRAGCELRDRNGAHDGTEPYNWFPAVLFPADQLSILAYNGSCATSRARRPPSCSAHSTRSASSSRPTIRCRPRPGPSRSTWRAAGIA